MGRRALSADHNHEPLNAIRYHAYAAACCRLAQAALETEVQHRTVIYERQAMHFKRALSGTDPSRALSFNILHNDKPHAAWLFRPASFSLHTPTVLVWGGADGWCEAFYSSVQCYLEKGLAVCLLELPGQGLSRLRHGSVLGADFKSFINLALDTLVAHGSTHDRFGVVGHSAGGFLALVAASADRRIRACCTNGGALHPLDGFKKYPRVLERFGRLMGATVSEDDVSSLLESFELESAALNMQASLLCLHGGLDPLVESSDAQALVALRGPEAILVYWPEGVHCLYNHAIERNGVLARWFASQLLKAPLPVYSG
jgi:alpha-beta hydrolase superfamily lysophospholipase